MLSPNNDRLDYGQVLSPPEGYTLDFAVGTTYSLDLDALVGICIALGFAGETDSDLMKNPICLLEALRSTGDKIALFCEGGQIHMPNSVTPLYILLEQMVFQVETAKKRGIAKYPSFHPKFWLVRYVDENGEILYRVVVLSRNLTFDRSWDVTFCMDGKVSKKTTDKNAPVADFLLYLCTYLTDSDYAKVKRTRINRIIKELRNVHFELDSKEFYDYDFIPVGVKSKSGGYHSIKDYPLFYDTFHELLVMSPFISNGVIKDFNDRGAHLNHSECVLITRMQSLSRLKPKDARSFRIFTMKDAVVRGEDLISDGEQAVQEQDIHAKVYMVRKNSDADLYLGSLNASHNAVNGNVEFMIRLRSKNRYLNLAKLTDQLFGGEAGGANNPFEEVILKEGMYDETDSNDNLLDGVIKEIARLGAVAEVVPVGEDYEVHITFGEFDCPYSITVSPLLSNKTAGFAEKVYFGGLSVTQLSEFYKITVSNGEKSVSRVIMIPTSGMPEERDKAIISGVINDKQCFYKYIALLLGEDHTVSAMESRLIEAGEGSGVLHTAKTLPPLYEKMLRTAATDPAKLKEIGKLIQVLSADGVVPEEFEELYNTFKKVVKIDG